MVALHSNASNASHRGTFRCAFRPPYFLLSLEWGSISPSCPSGITCPTVPFRDLSPIFSLTFVSSRPSRWPPPSMGILLPFLCTQRPLVSLLPCRLPFPCPHLSACTVEMFLSFCRVEVGSNVSLVRPRSIPLSIGEFPTGSSFHRFLLMGWIPSFPSQRSTVETVHDNTTPVPDRCPSPSGEEDTIRTSPNKPP